MISVVWRSNLSVPEDDLASSAPGQGYEDIGLPLRKISLSALPVNPAAAVVARKQYRIS